MNSDIPEPPSKSRQRISWTEYFMNIADTVKTRSLDPKTQVGAVLVSQKDNRLISTGYNSLPRGIDRELKYTIDWSDRELIRPYVIHAETNAVLYAESKFENSILYTTMSPCTDCIKLLSAAQIKMIVYKNEYKDIQTVKELCKIFGIGLVKYIAN